MLRVWAITGMVLVGLLSALVAAPLRPLVSLTPGGEFVYDADAKGNRVPDFSAAGYAGGGVAIPDVPASVIIPVGKGDSTARIQAALDHVAKLPLDANGWRGAVLLLAGRHEVAGRIRIDASGVVLRGQGEEKTTMLATGQDRRTLVRVRGKNDRRPGTPIALAEAYVPVGATRLGLKSVSGLSVGDAVSVEHPSTKEWIAALGMDRFPPDNPGSWLDWKPGTLDLRWERRITAIQGETITLDAPITMALAASLSAAVVIPLTWPGRIEQVGVENLRIESVYDAANSRDEEHAWGGVAFENARDGWVRQVTFSHLAGSAVALWESATRITVEDCTAVRPVSENAGYRRHVYFTAGGQTLFRRCRSEQGRHDFAVGALAAGPNVFAHCTAKDASQFSGPIESYASGVLYDNVHIDGGGLALTNREIDGHGVGWAAANSVLWQCSAPMVSVRNPPTAQNWAFGCWGQFVGDGHWRQVNEFVKPESLYAAQVIARRGAKADLGARRAIPSDAGELPAVAVPAPLAVAPAKKLLTRENGWLVCDGKLLTGGRMVPPWWRGHTLPGRAGELGGAVTRFVPGRDGCGFTDDLDELTEDMRSANVAILEHHWGLWYDRRRDDHQMIRRADGNVWPPFYEQPWARSGTGLAWDGLSKYDLTKFNPWYFARLRGFAERAEQKGLVLVQQMVFQHNVLEAGAHWADFPWRPANCLQETGFPEPPAYAGNKRVFMAEAFYDVTHPVRRDLHRRTIRHCLDTLGGHPNVVFQIGEEFTGPLAFANFWLDVVAEWEKETGRNVLVSLSCTKDVQDAILADPARASAVDVIDLRYWWLTADGGLYDPKGGENLAPRQQLREWKGSKARSDASVAKQIREMRTKHPERAILCSLDGVQPWAVLAAGGSVPRLPATTDTSLLAALPRLRPFAPKGLADGAYSLAEPGQAYLVYAPKGGGIRLDLGERSATFTAAWIDLATGKMAVAGKVAPDRPVEFAAPEGKPALLWLTRS